MIKAAIYCFFPACRYRSSVNKKAPRVNTRGTHFTHFLDAPDHGMTSVCPTFKVVGDTLKVSTIWTDPATFRRPYRYTLVYQRLPADYTAQESYCDPRVNGVVHP